MSVPLVVNRRSESPLHRQIYDAWRIGILTGRFHPGERVPSTRALAVTYGVARITVSAAYEQLLAEGYFETRHGSGTFVSPELPDTMPRPLRSAPTAVRSALTLHLSEYASRLGPIQRLAGSSRSINLSNVTPDLAHFPLALWRRLISRQLRRSPSTGRDSTGQPAGNDRLRTALAAHLSRTRAVQCSPEQIIIVSGSQQALDLCARLLLDPGDEAAVEHPGYTAARQLFLAHGATLRSLAVTDDGASLDGLSNRTRLVHVTPSHQFPTGVSMSLPRRLALVEWAQSRSAIVIEDDYDSEYRYDGPPLPAVQSLGGANVIYVGTFSNVMFRGLRIGYVVVPAALVEPFIRAKWITDRHTTLLEQAALADFIEEGHLDRHLRRMRRLYRSRRDTMIEELRRRFGADVTIRGDAAGMHITVVFRAADRVRAHAQASGVHVAGTGIYYHSKPATNEFILGFSAIGERTIREGIKRIAGAV